MKPRILADGESDLAIVKALLPPDLLGACELVATSGRSTLVSVARTLLIKHAAPIAVMINTDTLEPTVIAETIGTTRHLMEAVAGGTPYEIIYCVPHLEVIFFEAAIGLSRIFPKFGTIFIPQFAKTQPKEQLEFLFEKGGGPNNLSDFLSKLSSDDIEKLRMAYPIQHLIAFLSNNLDQAPTKTTR